MKPGPKPATPGDPITNNVNIAMPQTMIDYLDREALRQKMSRSELVRRWILVGIARGSLP